MIGIINICVHICVILSIIPYTWVNGGLTESLEAARQISASSIIMTIINILISLVASGIIPVRFHPFWGIVLSTFLIITLPFSFWGILQQFMGTTFEKCEPEEVTYRLDFHPLNASEKESYLQMYRDYGWEYLDELNDYSYFRKTAADVSTDDELEIFSDSESKMTMLKNIFIKRMLLIAAIVLLIGVPLWYQTITDAVRGALEVSGSIIWGILFLIYAYVLVHCTIGFFKLRKKYSHKM